MAMDGKGRLAFVRMLKAVVIAVGAASCGESEASDARPAPGAHVCRQSIHDFCAQEQCITNIGAGATTQALEAAFCADPAWASCVSGIGTCAPRTNVKGSYVAIEFAGCKLDQIWVFEAGSGELVMIIQNDWTCLAGTFHDLTCTGVGAYCASGDGGAD